MGIAAGGKQAFLLIEKTSPQFAFVDIQLSDGQLSDGATSANIASGHFENAVVWNSFPCPACRRQSRYYFRRYTPSQGAAFGEVR